MNQINAKTTEIQPVTLESKGVQNMTHFSRNSLSIAAFIAMTFLFGACSTQPLENLPVETVTQTPAQDASQAPDQAVDQGVDQVDDTGAEEGTLQVAGVPCLTYKIKKYNFSWPVIYQAGYAYGGITVVKSPSCKSPIKVSLEGNLTLSHSVGIALPRDKFSAAFDNVMTIKTGSNTYYTHFDLFSGTNMKPGTYKMAFRVQAGNVSKAVNLITVTLTR
jgi:hypothetical protein